MTIALDVNLDGLPPILGHAPEIREALTNLIFNAVDAMPYGGTLTLRGAAGPEDVTLTVTDTGIGMPPEVQAKVFEPFFTTKGVRGTGLGLAVVYGILERHGGTIAVDSTLGRGTTFTLTFQRTPAATQAAEPVASAAPLAPLTLLVVDDEPLVRTTLATLLRTLRHTVLEAADGPGALALLGTETVDCVLTDLGMPDMNGWELARAVKMRHRGCPVILLTGWQDQAPGDEADRGWVDVVIGKPVRLETLRRTIGDLARGKHLGRRREG
jgi:CheY-like chemotaxis protein